jgi:hypothetical protein
MGTATTSLVVGGKRSRIKDSYFENFPGANSTIKVPYGGYQSLFSGLLISAGGQTVPAIELDAWWCQLSNIIISGGGGISGLGARNALTGIYVYSPYSLSAGQYSLDLGLDWTLTGGILDLTGSSCNGIRTNASSVSDMRVIFRPAGSIGIASTQSTDTVTDNFVDNTNGGTPYSLANGTNAWNNHPWIDGLA